MFLPSLLCSVTAANIFGLRVYFFSVVADKFKLGHLLQRPFIRSVLLDLERIAANKIKMESAMVNPDG